METEAELHYHCWVFEPGGAWRQCLGSLLLWAENSLKLLYVTFISLLILPRQVEQDHCCEPTHCLVSVLAPFCSPGLWHTVPSLHESHQGELKVPPTPQSAHFWVLPTSVSGNTWCLESRTLVALNLLSLSLSSLSASLVFLLSSHFSTFSLAFSPRASQVGSQLPFLHPCNLFACSD